MKIIDTALAEVKIIEPVVFADERGFFLESYQAERFEQAIGRKVEFIQDNHSASVQGVLRGLHYQCAPFAQAKLVRCVMGEVFDVAVDVRPASATFGQWVGVVLSADNHRQLWIPEGFAHGFYTKSSQAHVLYKTNQMYMPNAERSIRFDDPNLNIDWPLIGKPILSVKDEQAQWLRQITAHLE